MVATAQILSGRQTVLFYDPIHPHGMARIAASHDVVGPDGWRDDPRHLSASVIVIRTTDLPAELIARMPALRLIVKHGAGVDNIPMAACTRAGIWVANTPGGSNATAVAEGAVTLMLSVLRRVRDMDAIVRENRWNARWQTRLGDLSDARVGLIGFGRIARFTARICGAGFGADVAACDPLVSAEDMAAAGVAKVDLPELLTRDVISIHVPLTAETCNLIGSRELATMHSGAIIVNTSRGGIIDEDALADALRRGRIAGAGIDVFAQEPPAADHPLVGLPNVVLSPHVAGVTEASMKGMALAVAEVIDTVLAGAVPATLLNREVLPSCLHR
ncbi:MAG: hydroxyacid dehydrogenase [Novosphingobium sp.]